MELLNLHPELLALFEADQNDRNQGIADASAAAEMTQRDLVRRQRTAALIAAGELQTAEDHLHAAFIFQHGEQPHDYWRAHELAARAVELGHPEERKARWMVAASYDRWLTSQGKPQKYGTQFFGDQNGWRLMDYDSGTTDEERAVWGVPPIAESLRRAEQLNRTRPAPKTHKG